MKTRSIKIGHRTIGDGFPCFIVAEVGSNHNNDFDLGLRHIDAAAEAGVDAVKFQTFRADQHYSKRAPGFNYLGNTDIHALIKSIELDRSWHRPLKQHAEERGLEFFSSPCDPDAIAELAALGVNVFKVASFDLPDTDLIRLMAQTGKCVVLSTGMADWMDIQRGVSACREAKNDQVVLLQCTSLYPAPANLSNLRAMASMRLAFDCLTGYSDHTEGDHIALGAVALGACFIEKHFTIDRSLPGPDHPFAMEPGELKIMTNRIRDIEEALGDGAKNGPRALEQEMYEKGRRSLHAGVSIPRGEIITADMLVTKRPGLGIPPHLRDQIIGRPARIDIKADQWLTWDML